MQTYWIQIYIHGRDIYTCENFYIFQKELWIACTVDCGIENKKENDEAKTIHIIVELIIKYVQIVNAKGLNLKIYCVDA